MGFWTAMVGTVDSVAEWLSSMREDKLDEALNDKECQACTRFA